MSGDKAMPVHSAGYIIKRELVTQTRTVIARKPSSSHHSYWDRDAEVVATIPDEAEITVVSQWRESTEIEDVILNDRHGKRKGFRT